MTPSSMTGFARTEGTLDGLSWHWELRSVNARGLDLRLRLPPGFDRLEPALRDSATRALRRGTVHATLAARRDETPRLAADPAALDQVLRLALDLCARIPGAEPPRADALLALPGILRPTTTTDADPEAATAAVRAGFECALQALVAARDAEGARLATVLAAQLDEIAALTGRARTEAAGQPEAQRARMTDALQALLRDPASLNDPSGHAAGAMPDAARIAQEIAILAARSDVREELDRLSSHTEAARALLAEGAAIGRRLDFLVQEFGREANTLCAKSALSSLTTTGLQLKATIEQVREQVQNLE